MVDVSGQPTRIACQAMEVRYRWLHALGLDLSPSNPPCREQQQTKGVASPRNHCTGEGAGHSVAATFVSRQRERVCEAKARERAIVSVVQHRRTSPVRVAVAARAGVRGPQLRLRSCQILWM